MQLGSGMEYRVGGRKMLKVVFLCLMKQLQTNIRKNSAAKCFFSLFYCSYKVHFLPFVVFHTKMR